MRMSLQKYNTLLNLRGKLQQLNQLSFQYVQINRKFPLEELDDIQADDLVRIYENLLNDAKKLKNENE